MLVGKALYEQWRVNARWSCGVQECVGDVLHHAADAHCLATMGMDGSAALSKDGTEVYKDGRVRLVAFDCGTFGRVVVGIRFRTCVYAITLRD